MNIRRHRIWDGDPPKEGLWIADWRSYDIPHTVCAAIKSMPSNCVAITLRPYGGAKMIAAAEAMARRCGKRILWVPVRKGSI